MSRRVAIQDLLHRMPEDADWLEILRQVSDFVAVQDGRRELALGHVVPHDLVRRETKRRWVADGIEE